MVEWVKSVATAVVLFLVIRTFLLQAYTIPSESMRDTLLVGDFLMANNVVFGPQLPLINKRLPGLRDPRRGDIVVFRPTYNDPAIDVVKRVIAQAGDTVQMINREVFLNGKKQSEPYVHHNDHPDIPIPYSGVGELLPQGVVPERYGYQWHLAALPAGVDREGYSPTRDSWGPLVVPKGHYLLLGDNRDESMDGRFVGFVPREVVRGKPMFVYFSVDKQKEAAFPRLLTAARWGRIGHGIQ